MVGIFSIGFLIEFIIAKFKGGIKHNPKIKRLALWTAIIVLSESTYVALCWNTSEEFQKNLAGESDSIGLTDSDENKTPSETEKNEKVTKNNSQKSNKATKKSTKQSAYQKLTDEQFSLLTEMFVKSFYSFNLSESDYQVAYADESVMKCLKKIYDYAYENYFEIDPDFKKAISTRIDIVKNISNYKELKSKFIVEYYRDVVNKKWVFDVSSYTLNPDDTLKNEGKVYVDAEGYLNPGVKLYSIEDNKMIEVGEVEDVGHNIKVDNTYFSYAVKVKFYDTEYSSGWRDGESMLTTNKFFTGKPLYYLDVLDVNRKIAKEIIDYSSEINWKQLSKSDIKPGTEVYYGKSNTKSYLFTINKVNKNTDTMYVSYPSGSVEIKSISAMLNLGYLYVK